MKCNYCDSDAVYTFANGERICKVCVSIAANPKEYIIKLQQLLLEQKWEIEALKGELKSITWEKTDANRVSEELQELRAFKQSVLSLKPKAWFLTNDTYKTPMVELATHTELGMRGYHESWKKAPLYLLADLH